MVTETCVRPTTRGRVIGVGLGQFRFAGSGVGLMLAACLIGPAFAGPEGAKVNSGTATIVTRGNNTIIRASDRAIIDYTRFDINKGEKVRFIQPGASARVLNRINSVEPTRIDGSLRSNGIVYFVNRAGVIFGPSAVVNTGGIYAAAGNMTNKDFLSGINRFSDVSGSVVNEGVIDSRFAALVGERVANLGEMNSQGGVIAMVAGNDVILSERGGAFTVKVDAEALASNPSSSGAKLGSNQPGVENSGTIRAGRGQAVMVAGDMYSLAIKNTGTVKANTIKMDGRGGGTVSVGGTLDASNRTGNGGSVTITGENIDVRGARVNADGARAGGTVNIGGDYRGQGTLRRADTVSVDKDSVISANATKSGNGGRVIVWSDNRTNFYGTATATAGKIAGDGGFIETSGKVTLDVRGATIRASSPNGKAGLWLMDPVNVNIESMANSGVGTTNNAGTDTITPDNSVSPAIVDVASIISALEAGTNVTVTTGLAGSPGTDAGNINVNAPIILSNPSGGSPANPVPTLTLEAANDINVNQQIAAGVGTLPLNVDLRAGNDVHVDANITTLGGTFQARGVNFDNTGVIQTAGGNIGLAMTGNIRVDAALRTDGGMTDTAFIRLTGATLDGVMGSEGINAPLIAGSGGVILQPDMDATTVGLNSASGAYNISLAELQQIQTTGPVTIGRATGTGAMTIADLGAIDLRTQGYSLRLRGGNTTASDTITLADNAFFTAAVSGLAGPSMNELIEIGGASGGVLIRSGGAVNFRSSVANLAADLTGGTLTVVNTGPLTIGTVDGVSGVTSTGNPGVSFTSTGLFTIQQSINTGTGNLTVNATNGSLGFVGTGDITGGNVSVTAQFNIFGNGTSATRITGDTLTLTATDGTIGQGASLRTSTGANGTIIATGATGIDLINTGNLTISLNSSGGDVKLVNTGTTAAGATAWTGRTFDIDSSDNLLLAQDITISGSSPSRFESGGTITLATTKTLDSNDTNLVFQADDVNFDGSVDAGTGTITIARNDSGSIALGDATGDLVLSKTELARMTTSHLILGGTLTSAINVNNVSSTDTMNIGFTSLRALENGADITFTGGASIFRGLSATADDSITVGANLSAIAGGLTLVANFDGTGDSGMDVLSIGAGVTISTLGGGNDISLSGSTISGVGAATISAARDLTLNAPINTIGALTLTGRNSITLNGDVTANGIVLSSENGITLNQDLKSTGGNIQISADSDNSGVGNFTLVSGKTIETAGGTLSITAADAILDGSIDATGSTVTIARSTSGAIGVGAATGDMTISGAEISRIMAGTLVIGSQTADLITVDALAASDTVTITSLVSLIANDIDIPGAINTGDAGLSLSRASSGFITVGTATGGLNISNDELARITTKRLTIGSAASGNVAVQNVALASTAGVEGLVSFLSGGTVSFGGPSNTFKSLDVKANNGVTVNTALTTTVGDLALDGDADGVAGSQDGVSIGSNRTLTSATKIILRSTNGGITGLGSLNLIAKNGIDILNNMTTSGTTVINADSDLDNNGTLLVSSGRTLATSGNTLTITADDVTLDGSINAGQGAVSILRSGAGGVGLGAAQTDMTLSGAEFGRIISTGLTIGGENATFIVADGLTNLNTNGIAGTTTLLTGNTGSIVFNNTNIFNALAARTGGGITVNGSLNTDAGNMLLNADIDGNAGSGDVIRLNAGLTAPTSGNISLKSGVVLGANVTVAGKNIAFDKWVSSDATARSLAVNSSGNGVTTFRDGVGGFNRLFTLTTNADGITRVRGDVKTTGSMQFFDSVRLLGDTTADASGGLGVLFGNKVDTAKGRAAKSLTVLTRLNTSSTAKRIPLIRFGGPVGATRALNNLDLNFDDSGTLVNGRTNVPAVPTIVARQFNANGEAVANPTTAFNMTFNTNGRFRMGKNEKLAVVGNLEINANRAVLGDVSTLGNMRINADTIAINLRQPAKVLTNVVSTSNPGGLSANNDRGVDFVAGGEIDFSVAPTLLGSGPRPAFAVGEGGDFSGTLAGFTRQFGGPITAANFNRIETQNNTAQPAITLDLVASGSVDAPLATVFAGLIPRDEQQDVVSSEFTVDQASTSELRDIGVYARGATGEELVATLSGVGTYDDVPRRSTPTATDYTTVSTRLSASAVRRTLEAYQDAFITLKTDESGNTIRINRSAEIQQALLESVQRFRGSNTTDAPGAARLFDPIAFRTYLETTPEESVSLGHVRQIASFLQQLELLGLTPRELTQSKAAVLTPIRPRGIPTIELLEAVIRSGTSSAVASQ